MEIKFLKNCRAMKGYQIGTFLTLKIFFKKNKEMGNKQSHIVQTFDAVGKVADPLDRLDDNVIFEICMWFKTTEYKHEGLASLLRFATVNKRIYNIVYHSIYSHLIWKDVDLSNVKYANPFDRKPGNVLNWPGAKYCTTFTHFIDKDFGSTRMLIDSMPRLEKLSMEIPITGVNIVDTIAAIAAIPTLTHLELTIDSNEHCAPVVKFGSNIVDLTINQSFDSVVDWSGCIFDSVEIFSIYNVTDNWSVMKICPNARVLNISGVEPHMNSIAIPKFTNLAALIIAMNHISEMGEMIKRFALDGRGSRLKEFTTCNSVAYAWDTNFSWNPIVDNFPNLVKLHIFEMVANPSDIKALSNLKHLEDLGLTSSPKEEIIRNYSAAFAEFGRSDGGKSLKKLHLRQFSLCDLGDFFSSKKCHELHSIEFKSCNFSLDSLSKLASNVVESLVHLNISPLMADITRESINCKGLSLFSGSRAFNHVVLVDVYSVYTRFTCDPCAIYRSQYCTLKMMMSDMECVLAKIPELTIMTAEPIEKIQKYKSWIPWCTKLSKIHIISNNTAEQHFLVSELDQYQ